MSEHAGKPEIRFAGFTETWEQRKLGELGSVAMCKRIFKDQTSEEGDVPFYKIGTFGEEPNAYISRELFDEYKSKYPYPDKGTILISASGSIGRIVEFTGKDEYFQDSNIVWLKHDKRIADTFLKYIYEVISWAGIEGSTIKRLYNDNILKTEVKLPCIDEQEHIGRFFRHLDRLVTLHQRKRERLENIKKAMLEKMFPKNGSDAPEIRFAGFTEAWEQRKLGEVSSEFKSGEFIQADCIKLEGDYPVYGGNGLRGYTDCYNHDGEYALIGRQGALCGNMNYSSGKAYFTEHAVAVKANTSNNTRFLYYLLETMNLGQYSGQSAQPGLAVGNLIELETRFPKKEEQARIGTFFRHLDRLITLHQRKVALLKNIKKACLEKMFI